MNSPLGKYAAPTAAIAAIGIIGTYLLSLLFGGVLAIPATSLNGLQSIALIAVGALFGSAVAVNGYKGPLAAATDQVASLTAQVGHLTTATAALHKRADEAGIAPAADLVPDPVPVVPAVPVAHG